MTTSDTGSTASHGNPEPIIDSKRHMSQQIAVIYTPNYHGTGTTVGRYVVMTVFNWLTVPFARRTDCISMHSDQFNWLDKIPGDDSNYTLLATYYKVLYDEKGNAVQSEKISKSLYEDDATVSNIYGFFFEFNLPNDILQMQYEGFSFLLCGVCRVKNYNYPEQSLSMSSQYIHVKASLALSVSFTLTSTGISVSKATSKDSFHASHEWDYHNDYYA